MKIFSKKGVRTRARVNELMDWFNTGFYREYGYHLVYPQLFPQHKRPSEEAHHATIEWGKANEAFNAYAAAAKGKTFITLS